MREVKTVVISANDAQKQFRELLCEYWRDRIEATGNVRLDSNSQTMSIAPVTIYGEPADLDYFTSASYNRVFHAVLAAHGVEGFAVREVKPHGDCHFEVTYEVDVCR